jgi:hypothetical protein
MKYRPSNGTEGGSRRVEYYIITYSSGHKLKTLVRSAKEKAILEKKIKQMRDQGKVVDFQYIGSAVDHVRFTG